MPWLALTLVAWVLFFVLLMVQGVGLANFHLFERELERALEDDDEPVWWPEIPGPGLKAQLAVAGATGVAAAAWTGDAPTGCTVAVALAAAATMRLVVLIVGAFRAWMEGRR